MRLSLADKVPVLTIVAGGAFGFAFSLGVLGWPATDQVDNDPPSVFTTPVVELDRTQEPAVQRPIFTPMTVRPEITNRSEVQAALMREYPPNLRDAGVGGRVVVWFFISETGQVLDRRLSESSGHVELDKAALEVADVFQFTPALNRNDVVQVWVQLPITFQVQ